MLKRQFTGKRYFSAMASTGKMVPEDLAEPIRLPETLPDKLDLFVAYATVPGYK